jgi:hypothetical protein
VLAVLWESAWNVAGGVKLKKALTPEQSMNIVKKPEFLPSRSIGSIGAILRKA